MVIDQLESDFQQLQTDIANGPILTTVTAEEIRDYLSARYDFHQAMPIEAVVADVEKMLRSWQVQVPILATRVSSIPASPWPPSTRPRACSNISSASAQQTEACLGNDPRGQVGAEGRQLGRILPTLNR